MDRKGSFRNRAPLDGKRKHACHVWVAKGRGFLKPHLRWAGKCFSKGPLHESPYVANEMQF